MINIDTHGDTFDNNNNNKNQQDLYPPSHLSSYTTTTFINNRTNQSRTSNSIDTDIDLDIDCLVNMKDKPDVAGAMAEERKGDGSKSSSLVEKDKDKDKDKDNTKSLDDSNNNNNGQDIDDIKIHSYILHIPQLKSWYNKIINICSSSRTKPIVAVVLYGTVSLCQTIFNKKVMSTFRFDAPNIMLFCQMLLSLFVLQTLKYTNTIKLDTTLNINIIKKLMPLSICYVLNVLLGLDSMKSLNIPMYSALKRLVAVVILLMEYFILGKTSPPKIIMSVFVMVIGAIVAGLSDLTFNAVGYSLVLLSCFFQASYLVYVKKTARDLSMFDMLYYNSALSLPFVAVLMLLKQEITYVVTYEYLYDRSFQSYFVLSVVIGFLLNFCIFFCTSVNSPLTTSITGQVKNIASTILGTIIFNDLVIHPYNVLGLVINMIGSIWYSLLKL